MVHGIDRSIKAKDGGGARSQEENSVPDIPQELLFVSSNPSLESRVPVLDNASGWIERLVGKDGITLRFEANHQHRWEGIGELQDTQGSDECREQRDLRNGRGNDEGQNPVYWHKSNPYPLAPLRLEEWKLEQVSAEVVVENLDTNIAVETCRNNPGDQFKDVSDGLPIVGIDALIRWIVDVLALKSVADGAINEIGEVDKDLAAK